MLQSYVDGVFPPTNLANVAQCRLGYWRFDSDTLWAEQGQLPKSFNDVSLTPSWSGTALNINGSDPTSQVTYWDVGSNGWANINCRQGSLRFWFKPNATGGPRHNAPFVYMGSSSGFDEWALWLNPTGTSINFVTASNGASNINLTAGCNLANTNWTQIVLTYGPGGSSLYTNGSLAKSGSPVTYWPALTNRNLGMVIGNTTAYNTAINGQFEEMETFNYQLASNQIWTNFQTVYAVDNNLDGVPDIIEDTVLASSTPFLGGPVVVAGTIEAEQFDRGGPGIAYSNVAANPSCEYRNTGMFITNCNDLGLGYCLDQTRSNEWARYNINVLVPETYAIETRVEGLGSNGVFQLSFATNNHTYTNTGPLTITSTNWTNVTGYVGLAAGTNVMTLQFMSPGRSNGAYGPFVGRFNYMTVYPWWTPPTAGPETNYVTLTAGNNFLTASNNAYLIQSAINGLPSTGGTVWITNIGTFYVAQPNPNEQNDAWLNAVANVTNNNIAIRGAGMTNTVLVGYNRATTIFYLGEDIHTKLAQCTNFTLRDITLQSQPHMAVNPANATTTVYETGELQPLGRPYFYNTGALTVFNGMNSTTFAYNILVTNCEFLNADVSIVIPGQVSNILVRACNFITWQGTNGYVPGQCNSNIPNSGPYYFGVGIYERAPRAGWPCNIGVMESSFNGNPNLTNYMTNQEGAANGFIFYQEGGNWFALRNFVTNNAEEGMQFESGPAAVAGNTFYSWANNYACCALSAWGGADPGLTGTGPGNHSTTFVGNWVWGNEFGELGANVIPSNGPCALSFSGNYLDLFLPVGNPSFMNLAGAAVSVSNCQPLSVCGNTVVNAGQGVYFWGASSNSVILANNFSGVTDSSILDLGLGALTVQDGQVVRNILARGDGYHLKVPYTQGLNWFLYQNQFINASSNSVPPFTDPASLPAHISN
jgi:hypothetical protein